MVGKYVSPVVDSFGSGYVTTSPSIVLIAGVTPNLVLGGPDVADLVSYGV